MPTDTRPINKFNMPASIEQILVSGAIHCATCDMESSLAGLRSIQQLQWSLGAVRSMLVTLVSIKLVQTV